MQTEKQFICLTLSGILDIPQIRQCKAIAHELDGSNTHICHIVLTRGADYEQTLRMIKEHCAEKLDAGHQPVWLRLYDVELPVAPSGKLNMSEMRKNMNHLIRMQ